MPAMWMAVIGVAVAGAQGAPTLEFSLGGGGGWNAPTLAFSGDEESLALLPGPTFSGRLGGGWGLREHLELGGALTMDMGEGFVLFTDRGPAKGAAQTWVLGPTLRPHLGVGRVGGYALLHPGVALITGLDTARRLDDALLADVLALPALDGGLGLYVKGQTEYHAFVELGGTWLGYGFDDTDAARLDSVLSQAPEPDTRLDGREPGHLRWRVLVGVWIDGYR